MEPLIQESPAVEVLYHDESIVVINKPAGMLSVPGRGQEKSDSAASRIRKLFPGCIEQPSVHRLDMDTSGLMVYALTREAHRNLSIQFQDSKICKKYIAVLDGLLSAELGNSGRIELRFRLDPANRPLQVFDPVQGKTGITLWRKLEVQDGRTRVEFEPQTGRTHQLRLHSANRNGLGCPIAGDRLYGSSSDEEHAAGERMMLHASNLVFIHPCPSGKMSFECKAPF
ncbi:MAG TPA: RNA pseudouridine synthase [Spirochaeta sp.]|nr:RNA pseudouridine synthase [Spirochaeta sp.]